LAPCTQSDDTSNHGALILAAWAVSVAARRGPRPKVEPKTEAQNGDTGHEIISIFGHFPSQKERSSPKAK